jgi:GR25 family glycosyltransferase involved in LPS biosynthesis
MIIHYLNLERRPDRGDRFLEWNAGVAEFRRFAATDGKSIDASIVTHPDVVEPGVSYSSGALGNALSHKRFWEECVARDEAMTIAEDDAVFNAHFSASAEKVVAGVRPDWDLVLWGWNFDSVLQIEVLPGLSEAVMHFTARRLSEKLADFQTADLTPKGVPLINAFGLVCYTVSPQGARRLLQSCFPLKNEHVPIRGLSRHVRNATLDAEMNRHFRKLNAYACFPPLVWTENERVSSDVV